MNIHPGFASTRVFHTAIVQDIAEQYANHPTILTKFNLPKDHNPVDQQPKHLGNTSPAKMHSSTATGTSPLSVWLPTPWMLLLKMARIFGNLFEPSPASFGVTPANGPTI
jgi:hypothetical protein